MDSFQVSLPKCGTYGIQRVQEGSLESQRVLFVKEILLGSKPRGRWIFLLLNFVIIASSSGVLSVDILDNLSHLSNNDDATNNYFSSVCPGSDVFYTNICLGIYAVFLGWNILMFFIDLWEPKAIEISAFVQVLIFLACAYCSLKTVSKCHSYIPIPCYNDQTRTCDYIYPAQSSKADFLYLLGLSFISFIITYNWEVLKEQAVRNKKTVDLILAAEQT